MDNLLFIKKILSFTPPTAITNVEDRSIQFAGRIGDPQETMQASKLITQPEPIPETFNSSVVMMNKMFPFMLDEILTNLKQESSQFINDTNNKVYRFQVMVRPHKPIHKQSNNF